MLRSYHLSAYARAPMPYLFETEEHAALRATARRFAQTHIAPHGAAWEEAEEFPRRALPARRRGRAARHRLPRGGRRAGRRPRRTSLVACEELVLAGRSVGTLRRARQPRHRAAADRPVRHARAAAALRRARACAASKIAALAITEPGGGSDVAALATRAVRDGDHYVVNGAKTFITSGSRADFVTTAVRTGGAGPRRHLAARDRARHAGLHGQQEAQEDRLVGERHRRAARSTTAACRSRNRIGDENTARSR